MNVGLLKAMSRSDVLSSSRDDESRSARAAATIIEIPAAAGSKARPRTRWSNKSAAYADSLKENAYVVVDCLPGVCPDPAPPPAGPWRRGESIASKVGHGQTIAEIATPWLLPRYASVILNPGPVVARTTAWALTPLMPNALQPEFISPPAPEVVEEEEGKGVMLEDCTGMRRLEPPAADTTCSLICRRCATGATRRCCRALNAASSEWTPAAPSA